MSWYLTKGWVDQDDGIDEVLIHYTFSPSVPSRPGTGSTSAGSWWTSGGSPRGRTKVLGMPTAIWDGGAWVPEYAFHYAFEVVQHGGRWSTELFTEEIASRELEFYDEGGYLTNLCVHWSVDSWEAPVYTPMEDPRFPAESEFASVRYYDYQDKPRFHEAKFHILSEIPGPAPVAWAGSGGRAGRGSCSSTTSGARGRSTNGASTTSGRTDPRPHAARPGSTRCSVDAASEAAS